MVIALEIIEPLALIGGDDIAHILLCMDIADLDRGIVGQNLIANRMNQVGFAQTNAAI